MRWRRAAPRLQLEAPSEWPMNVGGGGGGDNFQRGPHLDGSRRCSLADEHLGCLANQRPYRRVRRRQIIVVRFNLGPRSPCAVRRCGRPRRRPFLVTTRAGGSFLVLSIDKAGQPSASRRCSRGNGLHRSRDDLLARNGGHATSFLSDSIVHRVAFPRVAERKCKESV